MLMPSPYRDRHDDYIRVYAATGKAQIIGKASREVVGVRRDGSEFPLELGVSEWWSRGERRYTAILRDVTARRAAETALRESEERFRQIAEHVQDVFYVQESDGTISYVSPRCEALWGRPVDELYQRQAAWIDAIFPADRERVVRACKAMRA